MVSKIFDNILNEIKLLKMDFYYMNENSLMRGGETNSVRGLIVWGAAWAQTI